VKNHKLVADPSHQGDVSRRIRHLTRQNKKRLHNIMRECKQVEDDGDKFINKLELDQQFYSIYRQEFDKTCNILRELDFAEGKIMHVLYKKKQEDINEDLELADTVAKEYRSGGVVR
jgi:hypothetical protein